MSDDAQAPGTAPAVPGTLGDWFAKMMPDAEKWAAQFEAQPVAARPVVMPMGEPLLDVRKLSAQVEVPVELLMDYGIVPDTRPPRLPLPWRTRLRFRLNDWRERLAERAYRLICGHDVPEPEDW